tara:strand:- start:2212 stop:2499 length:288 start_codon:yes stop_codon:yes gene_type:complete
MELQISDIKPKYLVINPLHSELDNAPLPYENLKRYKWWDGTLIKVINTEKSYKYWCQAWKKELNISYDIDDKFNEKMQSICDISNRLKNIKKGYF